MGKKEEEVKELEIQTTFNEDGLDELVEDGTIENVEEVEESEEDENNANENE